MKFLSKHPNYKTYNESDFYYSQFPSSFWGGLQGFILAHSTNADELKAVCNRIAEIIPMAPTGNWGWDFLVNDLDDFITKLAKKKFEKVMDFLSEFAKVKNCSDELNEYFEESEMGYILVDAGYGEYDWDMKDPNSAPIERIEETKNEIKDYFQEALEHLQQASEHFQETHSDRDIKDAVRDCLSALESVLKKITSKNDIKDAIAHLKAEKVWGPDAIIKDGMSIWDRIHAIYPDIRHGQQAKSDISEDEAIFWVNRILIYLNYIVKRKKVLKK